MTIRLHPLTQVRTWQVLFVQDCNLRCSYCSSGFGTYGIQKGLMEPRAWKDFVSLAVHHAPEEAPVRFEFGGGETFLHYDEFLQAIEYLRDKFNVRHVPVEIHVTTNGTLLNPARLRTLAGMGVSLAFSIDGPPDVHDAKRRTVGGMDSHALAIQNWRRYSKLSRKSPEKPACKVHSVITDASRLLHVLEYWLQEGLFIIETAVEWPRDSKRASLARFRKRQKQYLEDLRQWAFQFAEHHGPEEFLSRYQGSLDLFSLWKKMFFQECSQPCGAGEQIMAVDRKGGLYPCELLMMSGQLKIGDAANGIFAESYRTFLEEKNICRVSCKTCVARKCCPGSCMAGVPYQTLQKNFSSGCWFAKELYKIAFRSYKILLQSKHEN